MRKCPSLWIIVVKKLYSEKINKRGRGWPILKKNLTTLSIVLPIQQSILSYVFYALGHYESLTRAKVLYPPRPFPCWDVGITFWICWQIWISVFPHSEFFVVPLGLRVILKSSFCTFEVLSWSAVSGLILFDPTAPIWSLSFSENKPRKNLVSHYHQHSRCNWHGFTSWLSMGSYSVRAVNHDQMRSWKTPLSLASTIQLSLCLFELVVCELTNFPNTT